MLMIKVGYPTRDEERLIMDRMAEPGGSAQLSQVASLADIERGRRRVRELRLDPKLKDYIIQLIFATREPRSFGLDHLEDFIEYGASPRATIYLNLAAKAHAFVDQRDYVMPEDIKSIAFDVLRHRVILTYEAEAEEYTPERVIEELLENIEVP
jgi:MoxR-like ATPase